eukprot:3357409-Prymnesium_polylepis.1
MAASAVRGTRAAKAARVGRAVGSVSAVRVVRVVRVGSATGKGAKQNASGSIRRPASQIGGCFVK